MIRGSLMIFDEICKFHQQVTPFGASHSFLSKSFRFEQVTSFVLEHLLDNRVFGESVTLNVYFLTIWMTSSWFIKWPRPTRWGLYFTLVPCQHQMQILRAVLYAGSLTTSCTHTESCNLCWFPVNIYTYWELYCILHRFAVNNIYTYWELCFTLVTCQQTHCTYWGLYFILVPC